MLNIIQSRLIAIILHFNEVYWLKTSFEEIITLSLNNNCNNLHNRKTVFFDL